MSGAAGTATPGPARASRRPRRHRAARHRLVEDREDPLGDRPAGRPRVIARGERAQREEELGDDDQDRQRALELDLAGHQPQADLDRHQRHGDSPAPFEDERGLEGRPEHVHRGLAVPAADVADVRHLLRATPEHLQRRQAAEHVEEEGTQVADLAEPPFRDRPRPAADDRQQEDEDRSGEQQHQRRRRVDDEDRAEHEEGNGHGQRPGRLVRGDVRIERVEAAADDAGQLAAPLAARPGRAEREHVRRQVSPQRALEPPRGTPGEVIDRRAAAARG